MESYWPSLFAKLAEKRSTSGVLLLAYSSGAAALVAVSALTGGTGGAVAVVSPVVEEKKV